MATDPMKIWRDMPLKTFFTIDGQIFQKNTATTALYVSNPLFGELFIGPLQAKAIKPYAPSAPDAPAPVAPRDPEIFETKVVEHPEPDPNFGATKITVTPVDVPVEQGIQPPKGTGKRKKAKKKAEEPLETPSPSEVEPSEEN